MSESKNKQAVMLSYDNWYTWDHYIKSTTRRKNAYIAFDPAPADPRTTARATLSATATSMSAPASTSASGATASSTSTPSATVTSQPTSEELKTYHEELREWNTANNVAAGVILGALSDEVQHVIDPKDPAKVMYDKLKAEVVRQSSGSSANGT
jgi:hypothetical protein